ncbi:MAG TPA: hypothetical protein VNL37_06200, partial [Candidatus Polarisedimenticolia bacterium]|nr:hypothetical protein [Candidatus Polarisedimenticolia bacterium]
MEDTRGEHEEGSRIVSGAQPGSGGASRRAGWLLGAALLYEVVNASYLAAFDSATIAYHAQVVAHVAVGLLILGLLVARRRSLVAAWLTRPGTA